MKQGSPCKGSICGPQEEVCEFPEGRTLFSYSSLHEHWQHLSLHEFTCACMCICMCVYMCIHTYVYKCTHKCTSVHTHLPFRVVTSDNEENKSQ